MKSLYGDLSDKAGNGKAISSLAINHLEHQRHQPHCAHELSFGDINQTPLDYSFPPNNT